MDDLLVVEVSNGTRDLAENLLVSADLRLSSFRFRILPSLHTLESYDFQCIGGVFSRNVAARKKVFLLSKDILWILRM